MALTKFTSQTIPKSGETLRQELQKAVDTAWPIDDFVQLVRELTQLELRHQLDSKTFYGRFQKGEMGDDMEFMRWATRYEIYQEIIYPATAHKPD